MAKHFHVRHESFGEQGAVTISEHPLRRRSALARIRKSREYWNAAGIYFDVEGSYGQITITNWRIKAKVCQDVMIECDGKVTYDDLFPKSYLFATCAEVTK